MCTGVSVQCDRTECVFEFAVYKYAGKHHTDPVNIAPPTSSVVGPNGERPPMGRGPPRPPPWASGPPMHPENNSSPPPSLVGPNGEGPPMGRACPCPPPENGYPQSKQNNIETEDDII